MVTGLKTLLGEQSSTILQQDHVEPFAISFEHLPIQTVKDKYKQAVSCVLEVLCTSDLFWLRVYINS